MYIIVIYGDGKQVFINPNCYIKLIIEYLRIKCDVPDNFEIDLCDTGAKLLCIYKQPYNTSGLDIFVRRETYFLVTHEKSSRGVLKKPKLAINPNLTQYDYVRTRVNKSRSIEFERKGDSKKSSNSNRNSGYSRSRSKLSKKSELKTIINIKNMENGVAKDQAGDL